MVVPCGCFSDDACFLNHYQSNFRCLALSLCCGPDASQRQRCDLAVFLCRHAQRGRRRFGTQNVIYTTSRGRTRLDIKDLQGLNRVTSTAFDGLDRVILTTLPEGNSLGYTYDSNSNVLTATATPKPGSPLSPSTTSYLYDPTFNKPTKITGPPTTANPAGLVTTMTYDPSTGNLLSRTADAGSAPHFNAQTRYTYNALGLLASTTDPLGAVTQFAYDGLGTASRPSRTSAPAVSTRRPPTPTTRAAT